MIFRYAVGKIADYQKQGLTFSFDPATPGEDFFMSVAEEGSERNDRFQNIIL
jgi:hypothetical protein